MNNTEDNKPGSLKRVVSPRPFEPGETIFHRSHGGSAVIVEITAKDVPYEFQTIARALGWLMLDKIIWVAT